MMQIKISSTIIFIAFLVLVNFNRAASAQGLSNMSSEEQLKNVLSTRLENLSVSAFRGGDFRLPQSDKLIHRRTKDIVNVGEFLTEKDGIKSLSDVNVERIELERIIERGDFLPADFLVIASRRQSIVGRIAFKAQYVTQRGSRFLPGDGWGTGFLVAPNILITNNHVLPNKDFTKKKVIIQFNYQIDLATGLLKDSDTYHLDPDSFFYTNKELDFTLVRIKGKEISSYPGSAITRIHNPGDTWGFYNLNNSLSPEYIKGIIVNIIQHPNGRPKEIAIHNNTLDNVLENHIRYTTDTEGGSSGSPVFDNTWTLVALHHSAGEKENGRWVNNQGVRIDRIISHIQNASEISDPIRHEMNIH